MNLDSGYGFASYGLYSGGLRRVAHRLGRGEHSRAHSGFLRTAHKRGDRIGSHKSHATSSGSASAYVRDRLANIKIAMYLEMFTSVGAIIGATITTLIAPIYLYFFFALFLMTSFLKLKPGSSPSRLGRANIRRSLWLELEGSYFDEARNESVKYTAERPVLGGLGMMIAGIAAGAFKVTVQENILRLPSKVASTTSNFIVGMTALAGVSVYFFSGFLNVTLMAPVAVGTALGAIAGGRVLNRLNDRVLRLLFYFVVMLLIVQMFYKGVVSISL